MQLMELMSLLKGAELAFNKKLLLLGIETDPTELITLLSDNTHPIYNTLISSCRVWLKEVGILTIRHYFWEGNKVAHVLANYARINSTTEDCYLLDSIALGSTQPTRRQGRTHCY